MKIRIYYDGVKYRIRKSTDLKRFINKVIREEGRIPGDLNFIITTDRVIAEINTEFLRRNYYTDVITFDYCEDNVLNGEIYISLETVRKNSKLYGVRTDEELLRTIIHGILHLCKYNDDSSDKRELMKKRENFWLKEYFT